VARAAINIGPYLAITKHNITAAMSEKKPSWPNVLHRAPGETLPVLNEALVELTLGLSMLQTWLYVTTITDKFILGLHVLGACNPVMDFEAPRDMTGPRRGVVIAFWSTTMTVPPYTGQ
jgi:hypothetical protein